jgi:hypothetical protein
MLSFVLGDAPSGRLYKALVGEEGTSVYGSAWAMRPRHPDVRAVRPSPVERRERRADHGRRLPPPADGAEVTGEDN